jgi:hypothetical protein
MTPSTLAPGSDVIYGGVGARDFISDGPGTDTIYGGRGRDVVRLLKDGTPDTATCGPGQDEVLGATSQDTIAADCEAVNPNRR